ncbi:hypothetical protein [Streptomyces sp. NPDC089799]|uniref:hypothetical protein n=1 Tax=Streptomyces sp. NPDC089799 TaxID=3155066 RepID=UPI00344A4A0D
MTACDYPVRLPMPGWPASEHRYSHRGDVQASGYTDEQKDVRARMERRMRRLAEALATHPFWAAVEAGQRVKARMALKRVESCVPEEA